MKDTLSLAEQEKARLEKAMAKAKTEQDALRRALVSENGHRALQILQVIAQQQGVTDLGIPWNQKELGDFKVSKSSKIFSFFFFFTINQKNIDKKRDFLS